MRCFQSVLFLMLLSLAGLSANEVKNGDFVHGLAGFMLKRQDGKELKKYSFSPYEKGQALSYEISGEEECGLYTTELFMRKAQEYTISFKAKSSVPVEFRTSEYVLWSDWVPGANGVNTVRLTSEWKTYSFTYKVKMDRWGGFRFQNASLGQGKAEISLAEISVTSSSGSDPEKEVTAGLLIDQPVLRFHAGENLPLKIDFYNRGAGASEVKGSWAILNNYTGKTVAEGTFTHKAGAGHSELMPQIKLPAYNGVLLATAKIEGGDVVNTLKFGVAPAVRVKMGNLPVDLGVNGVYTPGNLKAPELPELEFFRGCGLSIVRAWDSGTPFIWREIEPQENQFNWPNADGLVEGCRKADLTLLPVLGGMLFTYPGMKPFGDKEPAGHALPEWLYKKSEIKDSTAKWVQKMNRRIAYPPHEVWQNMVKTVVERYKGKVDYYEIYNEPNLCISAESYLPYLTEAHQIIKGITPKTQVVGVCATGDFNSGIIPYVEKCLNLDAGKYCDIISFHPYNNIFEDSKSPGDVVLAEIRERMKKVGCENIPIWNTELYFLNPETQSGSDYKTGLEYDAGYLARRHLLDAAYGVQASILIQGKAYVENEMNDHCYNNRSSSSFFQNRLIPGRNYIVSSVFADLLNGTKIAQNLNLPGQVRAYVFSGKTKAVAAFFAMHPKAEEIATVDWSKLPADVSIVDVYGNAVDLVDGKKQFALKGVPYYLCGKTADAVVAGLNALAVTVKSFPKIIGARMIPDTAAGKKLAIEISNKSGSPVQKEVAVNGSVQTLTVTPGTTAAEVSVPLTGEAKSVVIKGDGQELEIKNNETVVFGKLDALPSIEDDYASKSWDQATAVKVRDWLSFKAGYAGDTLCLAVLQMDTTPHRTKGKPFYAGDCVELYFDNAPLEHMDTQKYSKNVCRLAIVPEVTVNGEKMPGEVVGSDSIAKAMKYKFIRDEKGYTLNIQIPLSALGIQPGKYFGFDMITNDFNAQKMVHYTVWAGDSKNYCQRLNFAVAKLGQ